MKKLYQIKVRAELQVPAGLEKNEFLKLLGSDEKGLVTESLVVKAADNEEDAILEALEKYIEATTSGIDDYSGVIQRGEVRNKYYLGVSLSKDGSEPIQTKISIDLFPKDLGI